MKAFLLGSCLALILGIGTAIVYNAVGIGTAEHFAGENVQLPEEVARR